MSEKGKKQRKVAENRKAWHEYFIEETFQAGLVLEGSEVKSLRKGRCSIVESHILIRDSEAYLINMHIPPYEQGSVHNPDPTRTRKLLLHKHEIEKLDRGVQRDGYTIVPLKVYFTRGLAKIDIALAKGKKLHDKREDIARKTEEREMERAFKEHYR